MKIATESTISLSVNKLHGIWAYQLLRQMKAAGPDPLHTVLSLGAAISCSMRMVLVLVLVLTFSIASAKMNPD